MNPGRPPKEWFDKCVKEKSLYTRSPQKLCGWVWYQKMKPETRGRKTYEPEGRRMKKKNPSRSKIYVGCKSGRCTVFRSIFTPTRKSHGEKYSYVIGPFRTLAGAQYMALYGKGNVHLQHVDDAERLAKQEMKKKNPLIGPNTGYVMRSGGAWESHYGGTVRRYGDRDDAIGRLQSIARKEKHKIKVVDVNRGRRFSIDRYGNIED